MRLMDLEALQASTRTAYQGANSRNEVRIREKVENEAKGTISWRRYSKDGAKQ
jgi:hypothetical protein